MSICYYGACPHGIHRPYYCGGGCTAPQAQQPEPAAEYQPRVPLAEDFAAIARRLKEIAR